MSTGLNCQLIEPTAGEWWYILENYNAPKTAWDWREYASAYGPFATYDAACEHLSDNHANPGGHEIIRNGEYRADPVVTRLVDECRKSGNLGMGPLMRVGRGVFIWK